MVKSLRWRLQAWHAAILLLAISGFGAVLHSAVRRAKFNEIDSELTAAARVLEGSLRGVPREFLLDWDGPRMRDDRRPPGAGERRPPESGERRPPDGAARREPEPAGRRPLEPQDRPRGEPGERRPPRGPRDHDPGPPHRPPPPREHLEQALRLPASLEERYVDIETPPYFAVWKGTGEILKAQPRAAAPARPPFAAAERPRSDEPHARQHGRIREVYLAGPERTQIVVGRSIERELAAQARLTWQLLGSGGGVFVVGLAGGWWLSTRAVRPIRTMSATAASITAANLSRRIDTAHIDDELAELGDILNAMLDRLESAFAQQVRFTADASHELRTPLAVILSHAELALSRERNPEEYRAALEVALRSSRRMKLLVEELLTLARSDAGRLELKSERVDLKRVADESALLLAPLAEEHGVRLTVQTSPAVCLGDAHRLSQVATNLISNAILYNRPSGEVTVVTNAADGAALLTVSDTGGGVSQEDLPHLFERFYRVDRARARDRGGSGLGLAICQSIVAAHGGTIGVSSRVDVGSTFSMRLPQAP